MDLQTILQFEKYEMIMDEDPRSLLQNYLKTVTYLTKKDLELIRLAYEFALQAHAGVKRLSGEAYIIHPVHVLGYLLLIKPDVASLQTALLHDVIEDTEYTYEDIEDKFGSEVAQLCEGLVKVAKVRFKGEKRQIETLKKTFLAMGKDLRVIFIKIADRVHNIQTLHYHPKPEKRKRIADETLNIFVPIAKKLGLYIYQGLLENGSFRNIDYKEYKRIINFVEKKYPDVDKQKKVGIDRLRYLCEEENVICKDISGRLKSPYRIWKKLRKYQTTDITKVIDILAFRIITDSLSDCYTMLGVIHKHYTPIFSKMKDYISLPKPNGYKSLHTTILGMFTTPTEVQIRTQDMHDVAELGVAAHFIYSDESSSNHITHDQSLWIQKLQDIVAKYTDQEENNLDEDFKSELNLEILQRRNFVYTPKGDIFELPVGSTVLDFAFRIHSDIGLKFKSGFVNGKIVPIDYKLKTGDIVDIATYKNKYTANSARLKYVYTPTAKTKLQRYLKQEFREGLLQSVKNNINEKLTLQGYPLLGKKGDFIKKSYTPAEWEDALWRIYDKQFSIKKFLKKHYPDGHRETITVPKGVQKKQISKILQSSQKTVITDYDKKLPVIFDPECKPNVKDKIIAKSDKNGIKVHALSCPSLAHISVDKLYEAHRSTQEATKYTLVLDIQAKNEPGVLINVLKLFSDFGYNIESIKTSHDDPTVADVHLEVVDINPARIPYVFKELKSKIHVLKINKSFI